MSFIDGIDKTIEKTSLIKLWEKSESLSKAFYDKLNVPLKNWKHLMIIFKLNVLVRSFQSVKRLSLKNGVLLALNKN